MIQAKHNLQEVGAAIVRFAGDSGDGMQTVGEQFTDSSAFAGNDTSTLPDFPAEIRAPAGSLAGVSGFQLKFGSRKIHTPGDQPDALVAMNPAALKTNLGDLVDGGMLVVNLDTFKTANLAKAGYDSNPLEDEELREKYNLIEINLTDLTKEALADSPLKSADKVRCKNFLALGFMFYVYDRPLEPTVRFLEKKWGKRLPEVAAANVKVLKAGYYLGETMEQARNRYQVSRAPFEPGKYRRVSGNQSLVFGLLVGGKKAKREVLYAGYPITPASPILEHFARMKNHGVKSVQAEDEIAAMGIALGASFTGDLAICATSGPGICLKSEFIGLAVIAELPMIICDIQRGGPSTGLPTKTEQGDLLHVLYGRNGESPLPVLACHSPTDCFEVGLEAVRIALTYCTPVVVMSELYVANGSEPWQIPEVASIPEIDVPFADPSRDYVVYKRNPSTLAREQAIPGQAGLEHRVGGLEKDETGEVSYDPENHQEMTRLRAAKVARVAKSYPPSVIHGESKGDLLVLGWGGTYGAITSAVNTLQAEGFSVSSLHLRYLYPLPLDLEDIFKDFKKTLIPELNFTGHLRTLLRSEYMIDTIGFDKVQGQPFTVTEIREKILEILG